MLVSFFPLQQSIFINICNVETAITVTFSEQCFIRYIVVTGKRQEISFEKSQESGTDEVTHLLNNAKSIEILKVKGNAYFS
jgi:hypothetical protein